VHLFVQYTLAVQLKAKYSVTQLRSVAGSEHYTQQTFTAHYMYVLLPHCLHGTCACVAHVHKHHAALQLNAHGTSITYALYSVYVCVRKCSRIHVSTCLYLCFNALLYRAQLPAY
jgi:hypothetical protein